MIEKQRPINFRPVCKAESEDIKLIHKTYRELKLKRDANISLEILKSLNILSSEKLAELIAEIPLTAYRAKKLGIEFKG